MPHTTLISVDTLATNLNAGWAIVDCRFDLQNEGWGREQYLRAHIPGAVYASLATDLSAPLTGTNGRHPLPPRAAMAATFGRFGISPGTQVVVYDQDSGMYASRLWWMLRYAGHDAVAVLDGGFAKWTDASRPTRSGDEARTPATFTPAWRDTWQVDISQMPALATDPSTLLLDARAPERFEGRTEPIDRVAGHIPGARNLFFRTNVAPDGTMLPVETVRANLLDALGSIPPDRTVMYCGSGVTACHNLLAMEYAGLPGARLYAGSWSEWSADPSRPVETGPPRPR